MNKQIPALLVCLVSLVDETSRQCIMDLLQQQMESPLWVLRKSVITVLPDLFKVCSVDEQMKLLPMLQSAFSDKFHYIFCLKIDQNGCELL